MKKHIVLFISSLQKGGSERVMVNLAEYLNKEGYQVTMVTQHKKNEEYPLSDDIKRVFSEIEDSNCGRITNFVRRFIKLRKIWKTENPDIILSFIGKNNIMAILTAAFLKIPVVVSVRGEPREEYYNESMRRQARLVFFYAAGIIMQTKESTFFFPKRIRRKTVLLPNPLNPSFIRPFYAGNRDKKIVAVGRMDENKNHKMLISAFSKIHEKFPEYRLEIYGDGECRKELENMIQMLRLQDAVVLPGVVENVADYIQKASVFVLTSFSEGMPNTIMEAMALGIPCISTDCTNGGPRALIKNGENGILIPTGDEKALEKSLCYLLDNSDIREKISIKAYEIQKDYNPDMVNQQWKKYLEGVINS